MAELPFARDFGYLDKFFDNLETHAGTLPPAAGDRLRAMLSEERSRWATIQGLLTGAAPESTASPTDAPVVRSAPERPPRRMTIGSLIGE